MATDWIHIDTAHDMVRDECAKLEAELTAERHLVEVLTEQRNALTKDRDEWQELCNKALTQIEGWRNVCEQWQRRYYALKAGEN